MSDTESIDDIDRIAQLKTECLRQASNVTGLKGKKLMVVFRRSSDNEGEYYCALRGQDDGKYLKLWMDKTRTYPTHIEALEAYLMFVKRTRSSCRIFGASPKSSRAK